ncbi:MAG: hypothetical protein HQL72_14775 [Magnetococcales bacterium]|nr:hypothetical protein [Magnetococcales bacterium]
MDQSRSILPFIQLAAGLTLLCLSSVAVSAPPEFMRPPKEAILKEARLLVAAMKANPRGPFDAIRWFCKDGAVLPPKPFACAKHGGGRQHGQHSAQQRRLAELGWPVGTLFAALKPSELLTETPRQIRLRALPLERYLLEVDDGWVMRKAKSYRGHVQIEDEQESGRKLLLALLADRTWMVDHFILARELVRTIPHHGGGNDPTRLIRRLSQTLAEKWRDFEPMRVEIHGRPDTLSASRVHDWLAANPSLPPADRQMGLELTAELEQLYGIEGREGRIAALARSLPESDGGVRTPLNRAKGEPDPEIRVALLVEAMRALHGTLLRAQDGPGRLQRLEIMAELEAELLARARALPQPASRRGAVIRVKTLLEAARFTGWISPGEWQALQEPLTHLLSDNKEKAAQVYGRHIQRLRLPMQWAEGSVRHAFSEPLTWYGALEPVAARFVDDLLRGSILMPLADTVEVLMADARQAVGSASLLFGEQKSGMWALNPGLAQGRLRILDAAKIRDGVEMGRNDIVLLPETVSDLSPVAGIITLGEGNPLSHVQMLARNLGIPNVGITPEVGRSLTPYDGRLVELIAATDGRAILHLVEERSTVKAGPDFQNQERIIAPAPDLSLETPLPLKALHAALSGRVVGPKAANVGELARLFPGRVAPAVALPFGIFARHVGAGEDAPLKRARQAFKKLRAGLLDEAAFKHELELARQAVLKLTLDQPTRTLLAKTMIEEFGELEGVGLFVRSDTNVEDLPGFTGAGLNETVPHVVGFQQQVEGISRVWASVYTWRSMSWRSQILSNPEDVYASVLLMQSVSAEKSGVLVTTDLTGGGPGITVSVAWGVGGAVDNESAQTLVLRPDNTHIVLAEAKAPYKRVLLPQGGVGWRPALTGPVLNDKELMQLRELAQEVAQRYPPAKDASGALLPWDVEFAFAEGKVWLMQIRPLVQRGAQVADQRVAEQLPLPTSEGTINLDQPLYIGAEKRGDTP